MCSILRKPPTAKGEFVSGRRSYNYVVDKMVERIYNRYNTRKVEDMGADGAAARWLVRCAASFRPKGQKEFVNTKRMLRKLSPNFVIEAIDASDSIVHHRGFEYLNGLEHLKELRLNFCYWVDDTAITKVTLYSRNTLERLEIIGCGNVTMTGLLACQTLKNLKVLYACHLPQVSEERRLVTIAQLTERLGKRCQIVLPSLKSLDEVYKFRPK